ncbi:hypothetical protein DACRYDRAFT_101211 [Dacryopinax primogenitus]|uniref:Uncharacterized protein n=1 Tax=Dacryopinax primogenitus (strain DJM 731) TaxID=1858805 RepID=M5G6Y7_DACPD|nr:uncharacterized protein DACRYDRAFT_101211 [Dacryopinax primogenitus]EJT99522.1 hypothetical protein DACRYDRAFT_101211 [Dacryopinax primogenitus]
MALKRSEYSNQRLDKDGIYHVDVRQPGDSTISFHVPLDDILGISERRAVSGQKGFFSSKLTDDVHLDAKDLWKLRYKACSVEGKNDWMISAYDLFKIVNFENGKVLSIGGYQSSTVTNTESTTNSEMASDSYSAERHKIEERLHRTEGRIADLSRTVSSDLLNIAKVYGDYDSFVVEIKKRDTQMALILQDQADIYRGLSLAYQRLSRADIEHTTVTTEQTRTASQSASITESKTTIEKERTTLQIETDRLRKELLVVRSQNDEREAASGTIRAELEEARTTIIANSVIIKQFESWKALYMGQVQTMKKELFETTEVMTRLEETYQETLRALRKAKIEKEELQSTLILTKSSQTEVDARINILEQALQDARAELWRVSQAYTEKMDGFDGMSTTKAELERRISELTLSFAHERNVTRSLSERLLQIQGSMSASLDWIYDMRHDLTDESSYIHSGHFHSGGGLGSVLERQFRPRLPSYGSAVKTGLKISESKTYNANGIERENSSNGTTTAILSTTADGTGSVGGNSNGDTGPTTTTQSFSGRPPSREDIKLVSPIFESDLGTAVPTATGAV